MSQPTVIARGADIFIGGPLRLAAVMAAFQAGSHGLDLAYRVVKTAGSHFFGLVFDIQNKDHMKAVPEAEYKKQNETKFSYLDIRGNLARQEPMELLKNGLRYAAIAIVLKEVADRAVGSPVKGFNMIGSVLGLQILSGSIIENLPAWNDWKGFFERMSV